MYYYEPHNASNLQKLGLDASINIIVIQFGLIIIMQHQYEIYGNVYIYRQLHVEMEDYHGRLLITSPLQSPIIIQFGLIIIMQHQFRM